MRLVNWAASGTMARCSPDDAVSTLTYSASNSYGAIVTMKYNASRGVFTYRLPPVKGKSVEQAGSLRAAIAVHDRAGNTPRPTIVTASLDICGPPIKNG
jgi:hypothetical protein